VIVRKLAVLAAVAALAACSFQNPYESEAQKFTEAVAKNDLTPVQGDIADGIKITRVQVAEWSDELAPQGKLVSVKETTTACPPESHCFDVKFEKKNYVEVMRLDDKGKIKSWRYFPAPAAAAN
jgi:hypothetical protein